MSKWLVIGAGGLVGKEMHRLLLHTEQENVTALDRSGLDIRDRDAVESAIRSTAPDVVVNCAAWTSAEKAELAEADALAVNGTAVGHVAAACAATGTVLIHISTDYVFGGTPSAAPYNEYDPPNPVNAYGRTKLAGERAVLDLLPETGYVIRTAWVYGEFGPNFVHTMMRLEQQRETLEVVDDQTGQPTWSRDLAQRMLELGLLRPPAGIYHGTNGGQTTWCGLAREVFGRLGADPRRVGEISTADRHDIAPRPAYSALGHDRWAEAGLAPPRDWRLALREAFPAMRDTVGGARGPAAHAPSDSGTEPGARLQSS